MGSPSTPAVPNTAKAYEQGIQTQLKYLPQELSAEFGARQQYDPANIAHQQDLQSQYGPTQYSQMLDAFNQLDPGYTAARQQLGQGVSSQYAMGSQLDPTSQGQIEQYARAAQAARGNISGSAPATAEAYALGDRGQQLQQQRTQNMVSYLTAPTIPQLSQSIAPVSADRSFNYVNPAAGQQGQNLALQNYQNVLGQSALNNSYTSGLWNTLGTVGGSLLGGAAGYG